MSLGTGVFYTLNEDNPSYALHGINGIRLRQFANGYDRAAVISDQGKIYWVCGGPEPGSEMEQIFDSLKVASITFSKDFALLLDEDGRLYSWGRNKSGQLGHGHIDDLLIPHNIEMINRFQVVQCACSETHCACVTKTGGIYTWGRGFEGQSGLFYQRPMNDNYPQGITLKPTYISYFTGKNVKKVACGADFTVVLTEDGSLYTFGNNNLGQLGSGNKNRSYFPLFIVSGEDRKFEDISCGIAHTMARTTEGEVFGWGSNLFGQLGFPKEQKLILGPQKLIINETIGDFYDISCSNNVSSVVDFEGHIWVMGYRNTPVFNQYKDVLISDSNILPPTLLNYKDNYLTNHVSIGYQHMLIFVPTYISEIIPSTGPLAGNSPIVLKGCGFFNYPNVPITVRFNFGPQQPVQYITGFYDPESDTITCNTPSCQPEEIKIEMSESEGESDTDEDSARKNSARAKAEKEKEEKRKKEEEDAAKELSIAASIDLCLNGEDFTDEGIQFEYYVTPKINNIIPVNCQCDIPTVISFYAKSYGKAPTENIKIMFEEIIEKPPPEEPKVEEEEEEEIISNSSDEDEEDGSKKEIINEGGEGQSEGKVGEMPSADDPKAQTVFVNEENKEGESKEENKENGEVGSNEEMKVNELGSEIQQDESQQPQEEEKEEEEEEEEDYDREPHQIVVQAFMNEVPITDPSCQPILKDYPDLAAQLEQILEQQEAERLFQQQQMLLEQQQQQMLLEQQQLEEKQLQQPQEQQPEEQEQPEQEQSMQEQQSEEQLQQRQLIEEQQQQFSNIPTIKILQCTTPVLDFPIKKPMKCKVKIAMNGMNFDDIEGFEFIFFDIKLKSIIPGYISSEGGYLLNINGSGFVEGLIHQLRLQFGEQVTHYDCEFVNGKLLTLSAPKLDMTSIPPPPAFGENILPPTTEGEEQQQEGEGEGNGEEEKNEEEKKDDKDDDDESKEGEEGDEEKKEGEEGEEQQPPTPEVKKDCLREYQASITCNGRNYSNTYPYIVYSGQFVDISPRFGQKEGGTLVSIIPNSPILHELTPEQSGFIKVTIKSKTQEETLPAVFNVEKQCIEFTTPKLIEIEPPPELVQAKGKDKGGKAADKVKDKGKKGKKDAKKDSPRPVSQDTAASDDGAMPAEPEFIETDPIMKLTVSLNQYENIQLSDEIVYTYLPIPELAAAKPNTLKPDGNVNFTGTGFVQSKDIKFKVVSDYLLEPVYVDGTCSDDCKTIQATFPALAPQQNDDPKLKKSGYPARISVTLNLQEYSNEINVTIKY